MFVHYRELSTTIRANAVYYGCDPLDETRGTFVMIEGCTVSTGTWVMDGGFTPYWTCQFSKRHQAVILLKKKIAAFIEEGAT